MQAPNIFAKNVGTESIEFFIEGHAFSRSYDCNSSPPPHLTSVTSTLETQEDWERETT